ncbi:protein serine/threonine phosphatase 2C [Coprinopsis marcescibilis]|uniref:Protein serine/threonine phosphatase 2C n=1 Tax=Coprinopsis marcescibilis TaxID=230819 RepID=A0A5C3KLR4_COPMA|nr:protein serine/threonine phosphatase 2C [Coprinopsis marcescibilis]
MGDTSLQQQQPCIQPPPGPWKYTLLTEPALSSTLAQKSAASIVDDTHHVSFQPCSDPAEASQDRFSVQNWEISGGVWRFRAVFDGHGGHEAVDYTLQHLPALIERNLRAFLEHKGQGLPGSPSSYAPGDISKLITDSISSFDDGMTAALFDLFPGNAVRDLSDEVIDDIIHDPANYPTVIRCMRGTTVLISLTNPLNKDLWVASLGDCRAVLATRLKGGQWVGKELSYNHNGSDPSEVRKLIQEHPREPFVIEDDRVLGSIAVTRAIGDHVFKVPRIYTERVFLKCRPGFKTTIKKVESIVPRILTPPYVSNAAETTHFTLDDSQDNDPIRHKLDMVLFLFSDGLYDLYEMESGSAAVGMQGYWSYVLRNALSRPGENLALNLLRHGLGGNNEDKVSQMLMGESSYRWMDDTTILAQHL